MTMLLFVSALLVLAVPTLGENPAVRVTLTDKGLQYGKHAGAGWVQDKLKVVTLPDISGTVTVLHCNVRYTLTGTKVEKCDFPEPEVEFYKDSNGLKTSITGLSVSLTGEWKARYGFIHTSGSFNMAIFNVDLTTLVQLGEDANGRLSVSAVKCLAKVGSVDVQLRGTFSWMYRSAVQQHLQDIRAELEARICPVVNQSIVNFEHHLQTMNVSFDLNQALTLEMPLTNSTVVDASGLSLGFKGEFYSRKNHSEPPFPSQPFTLALQPGYMLSLGLSEFTLNSATYGYFSAGLLQTLVNDSMIPSFVHLHLNTSEMGQFVPQLPDKFPGLPVILQVYATKVPLFSFRPDFILFDLQTSVKAFAIQKSGCLTPLFKLGLGFEFSGKVLIADEKLKGSVTMNNLTVTLEESEVGTFKTDAIEDLVRKWMNFAVSVLNKTLSNGRDLPRLKHAALVNTELRMDKGFIAISSDFELFLAEMFADAQIGLFD